MRRSELLEHRLQRWQRRAELFDADTIRLLETTGVGPGWICLDVGAGAGSIARWLAERVGARGRVVATDLDEDALACLTPYETTHGIEVLRHDIVGDDIPREEFDLVHIRFVLEHLPRREAVIDCLAAGLKPGGCLFAQDAEFASCSSSDLLPYRKLMHAFTRAMALTGTDYDSTTTLPRSFVAAGLIDVRATGEFTFFRGSSPAAEFWLANCKVVQERMINAGLLGQCDFLESEAVLQDPTRWFPAPSVVTVIGKRPTGSAYGK